MDSKNTFDIENEYYKAYEKRYKQVYRENCLWSAKDSTPDVSKTIKLLKLDKNSTILEIGCGEGRDAIPLLNNEFNVLALDYSKTVINKCNELSSNSFTNNFMQFDVLVNKLDDRYDFIYTIAVLHMFITKEHRYKFLDFIYTHLNDNGYALIGTMGDGIEKYESNLKNSFKNVKRVVLNNDKNINIAATSCKIVNWNEFENELLDSKLKIEKKWISDEVPEFKNVMFVLVRKGNGDKDGICLAKQ